MSPYHLNIPGSQGTGSGYTPPSTDQDPCAPPSLQGSSLEHFLAPSRPTYSLFGHDGHESSLAAHAPQFPKANTPRSLRLSVASGPIRTPSFPSSHPYQQARLRHIVDRASAQHQGCSQIPLPAIPTPASARVSPYHTTVRDDTSARCHGSSQLPLVPSKVAPPAAFGSASQFNVAAANANQNMLFMESFAVPEQMFLAAYQEPPSPPSYTLTDEADIEYAQYRYGDKRCFYQCRFDLAGSPCHKWIVGDRTRVLRHLRNYHHLQMGPAAPALCRWEKCTHSRPMKQENLSRHIVMHLGVKWKCPHCNRLFSRDDAVHRHIERMVPGMDVTDAEVIPGCEARALNELQSKRACIA